ncbi:HORMA domain containing protein [Dyella choica]|uniref:HORMA domain containing protein n=1 Tax=Dyella choica TaxID=1927959 RepID=A0A3S0Q5J4_9GAMM|nr:HORMA domain containing protein [Dyella choica]RUL77487.1 HORMA domain containing protein [Dyella choica]
MTTVSVYSYTHSVTYVADNILKSLKDIVRLSGLDPGKFANDWDTYQRGIRTWLESEHLEQVTLEVYHPTTDALITRWDITINYQWTSGDGSFWTDTEQLRYAIQKAGVVPSQADYRLIVHNKSGKPAVDGWSSATFRATDGMVRQSLGGTVQHQGLSGSASYWRKA